MKDISLWLITNKPDIAAFAVNNGVDRIFVDLELIGKLERQGHLNTVISYHTINDVKNIRKVVTGKNLLVRSNPIHPKTKVEIEEIVDAGADIIMLPMWKTMQEVETFVDCVAGRAKICLLAETPESLELIPSLCKINAIDEFHIGLNDLHLALHKKFMFELLLDGTLTETINCLRNNNKVFGIGGLARIGEGLVPAETILAEHIRLGSQAAILSRTFHRNANDLKSLKAEMNLREEINKIKSLYNYYQNQTEEYLEQFYIKFENLVKAVLNAHAK